MKVRIHLDGSQTLTGTAEECAEFMGLRDQQCEWPEPTGESFSGFVTDHPEAAKVHKIPGRGVSVADFELLDILAGNRPQGLSDRDYDEAKALARKLRIIGAI